METKELKLIPLARIFELEGVKQSHRSGNNVFYFSPFVGSQKTGSLGIIKGNRFNCLASGENGDCFSFIMKTKNMTFYEAKKYLCEITNNTYVNTYKPLRQEITTYTPIVASNNTSYYIKDILNFDERFEGENREGELLLSYCESRGISRNVASYAFKKIVYGKEDREGKTYYGVGMENENGGYEMRNKYVKCSTPGKGVSTIKGKEGCKTISVFEGMFDYASAIQYYSKAPSNHVMILHSLSFMWKLLEAIEIYDIEKVFWFGDNDDASQKQFAKIEHIGVNMAQEIYPNHKDFNDFLISRL